MQNNLILLPIRIAIGVVLIVPTVGFAQLGNTLPARQQLQQERAAIQQQNQQDRSNLRVQIGETLRQVQGNIQAKRGALKTEIVGLSSLEAKKRIEEFRREANNLREGLRMEIKNERDAFKTKTNERRDDLKKSIGDAKAQRVEMYFTNMTDRMDAMVDRLDTLADRTQSRLDKIHDAGKDTAEPQAALDAARLAIAGAHSAISDAKTKFSELSTSTTPKEEFPAIKELINIIKIKSKEAHAALVEVINSIKKGHLNIEEATSTQQAQ